MVAPKRILNVGERKAQEAFLAGLEYNLKPKTKRPIIVAIIGLVGSGKSRVAKELAKQIGATIIENDQIRVELRKQKAGYDRTWAIAENAAIEVTNGKGNVVLDSDFVDKKKRVSLRERAKRAGCRLVFIRTICDFDVMSERIRTKDPGQFFNEAVSVLSPVGVRGGVRGNDVKMLELWRRTPNHYRWINQGGGRWVLKKFPFAIFAEIHTTDTEQYQREVAEAAEQLLEV